jgi:heme A synthase
MTATATTRQPTTDPTRPRATLYRVLSGLTSLAVILQGLWAGIFLEHDGERDASSSWIEVHACGADVAVVLALLVTVAAFVGLRSRRDLWLGSGLLTALLVVESYIGGLIRDDGKDTLTAVHVPLAMAVLALAIWLPVRAGRR